MKELLEEKAKRYDEAIEKFDVILNLNTVKESGTIFADDVRKIFPELKESEDKMMIQYFKDLAPFDKADELYEKYGFSHKDAIAWLEKQGEHQYLNDNFPCFDEAQGTIIVEKQGEQKPADKVEPKFHEGDIIIHKELGGDYIHNSHKIIQVDILDKKYRLEGGLVAHFSEQDNWELVEKNSAWSEEEVEIIDWLVSSFDCLKIPTDTFYQSKVRPFLISLRNKIQPIINEWSEEDCNQIETIACHLDNIGNGAMAESLLNIMNKYKSLRHQSQWKPSDEQMKALNAINIIGDISYAGQVQELINLYNDLKKLKEL